MGQVEARAGFGEVDTRKSADPNVPCFHRTFPIAAISLSNHLKNRLGVRWPNRMSNSTWHRESVEATSNLP